MDKEKYIKENTNKTISDVVDTLCKRDKKKGIIVRPTGFGKSFLLSNLTSNEKLIQTLKNKYHTQKYSHGDIDKTKLPVRFLYVYPTDIIKESVIKDYGTSGMNILQNTYFISYQLISRIAKELTVEATKEEVKQSSKYTYTDSNNKSWKLTNNKLDKKQYILKFRHINNENSIYEVTSNKSYDEQYIIDTSKSLTEFFATFDIVMLDECHRAAADKFKLAYSTIDRAISDDSNYSWVTTQLIGVTATPYRLDGRDIGDIFGKRGGGRLIGQGTEDDITLSDAIKTGLMNKFDYLYCVLDKDNFLQQIKDEINTTRKFIDNNVVELSRLEETKLNKDINKIKALNEVLKNTIDVKKHLDNPDYMKFVIFFQNKKSLVQHAEKIYKEFNKAFPQYTVNPTITVSGKLEDNIIINDTEYNNTDIKDISSLGRIEGRKIIDLIYSVDQLNMGYHVGDIAGVVLMRATNSAVIYNQQIGRCFNIKATNTPIIIDIIDKYNNIIDSTNDANNISKQNLGEKIDLPSLIDKECVNLIDETKEFMHSANAVKHQSYDKIEEFVQFWKYDRKAPIDIIAHILNVKTTSLEKYYKK